MPAAILVAPQWVKERWSSDFRARLCRAIRHKSCPPLIWTRSSTLSKMELLTDLARADWLIPRLQAFGTVGGASGGDFQSYARILHPVAAYREDPSATDEYGEPLVLETSTWRWSDVAARTGQVLRPNVSWHTVSGREDEDGLKFDDGWRVEVPEEGWFSPPRLTALTEHLTKATATPFDIVAAIWDGWGDINGNSVLGFGRQGGELSDVELAELREYMSRKQAEHQAEQEALRSSLAGARLHLPHREYYLLATTLPELAGPSWMNDPRVGTYLGVGHTPQLMWPEDHVWVVATEIDSDSTLVAGDKRLIRDILGDGRLEAFEVTPNSYLT